MWMPKLESKSIRALNKSELPFPSKLSSLQVSGSKPKSKSLSEPSLI